MALSDPSRLREVLAHLKSGRLWRSTDRAPTRREIQFCPKRGDPFRFAGADCSIWILRMDSSPVVPGSVLVEYVSGEKTYKLGSTDEGSFVDQDGKPVPLTAGGAGVTNSFDWIMGTLSLATPPTNELKVTYDWRPDLQDRYA